MQLLTDNCLITITTQDVRQLDKFLLAGNLSAEKTVLELDSLLIEPVFSIGAAYVQMQLNSLYAL